MDRTGKMAASSIRIVPPRNKPILENRLTPRRLAPERAAFPFMFDNLSEKLQRVFKNLRGEGKLSAENMEAALREIRLALLEADVNFKVVKQLIENIKVKAMGEEVLTALSPSQQVVKIVNEEMVKILGSHESRLRFANDPPSVFLIVGLQGSGKTTTTGKLARWLSRNGHRPLMVSVDVYRPAAREQLKVIAREVGQTIYEGAPEETKPLELARSARPRKRQYRPRPPYWWIQPAACTSTISS